MPTLRRSSGRASSFGVSTHDEAELASALEAEPDYVALGPIYETKLKAMPWAPQGLERIKEWRTKIGALPLVAIGGLTPERASGVIAAGADSLAVITDFLTAPDPERRSRALAATVTGSINVSGIVMLTISGSRSIAYDSHVWFRICGKHFPHVLSAQLKIVSAHAL